MNARRLAIIAIAGLTLSMPGMAANINLSPGANITATIEAPTTNPGDVILLAPGTYTTSTTPSYPFGGSFGIAKAVTIRGTGASPANVVLAGGNSDHGVYFLRYPQPPTYATCGNPSGARLENLTITTARGGASIYDFVIDGGTVTSCGAIPSIRFADITLKDVVINTPGAGAGFGVYVKKSDRIVLDNVTITSFNAGINFIDVTESLVMNSKVVSTAQAAAPAIAVQGGNNNVIVGNTFGNPKANPAADSGYSFTAGGVVLQNTLRNRFENNIVQGFRQDGLDVTSNDLTGVLPAGQNNRNSTDNYLGKNTVVATSFAAGLAGGSGIWSNCGSHNTWIFGNESRGSREGGLTVWLSNSNMVQGNLSYDHGILGAFVSGGTETNPFCTVAGGAYIQKPNNNYLRNNYVFYNREEQFLVRTADATDVSLNFAAPTLGRTGPQQPPVSQATGQSAWFLQTDSAAPTSNGFTLAGNISVGNVRGLWDDDSKNDPALDFFLNRIIGASFNRFITSTPLNIDAGPIVGGNFWTQHIGSGNPSSSTPYSGVFPNIANTPGLITDRYPFQTEDMGRGHGVQVFEPKAGWQIAAGTKRTVRWYSPGCIWVDIRLDGSTTLSADMANTGYAIVTIPSNTTPGSHNVSVHCKDSSGTLRGPGGSSGTFTVFDGSLQLLTPGRDDTFNANTDIFVAWKKTSAVGGVDVQISTDGGANFTNATLSVGGAATGQGATFARIKLPNVNAAHAVIRVASGGAYRDTGDGVFALRGASPGFTNIPAGRKFTMGGVERIEWTSPPNSRVVTLAVNGVTIAPKLPDRGNFDWIPKDMGPVAVTIGITYYDSTGTSILGTASNNSGSTLRPSSITFGAAGTIPAGSSQSITATVNSGAAVTLTSLTPSICSVTGSTANALSNGTCTISASAPATSTYAAISGATLNFTVGAASGRLMAISTRMLVLTGDNVLIGGFIVGGSVPKKVIVNARGPSLQVAGPLADPFLQLVRASDNQVTANNDWQQAPNAAEIQSLGLNPPNNLESSILQTLNPGAYTAIVQGVSGGTGIGIVEVFEVDTPASPLTGISTRGLVQTGDNVMIGGFISTGSGPLQVIVRARGPSLGIPGVLANPTLTLVQGNSVIGTNDNWGSAANAGAIQSSGFAPSNPNESAILTTLAPGAYTAIVSGVSNTTGIAIVEVYVVP